MINLYEWTDTNIDTDTDTDTDNKAEVLPVVELSTQMQEEKLSEKTTTTRPQQALKQNDVC